MNDDLGHLSDRVKKFFLIESASYRWGKRAQNIFQGGVYMLKEGSDRSNVINYTMGTIVLALASEAQNKSTVGYAPIAWADILKQYRRKEIDHRPYGLIQELGSDLANGKIAFNPDEYIKIFPNFPYLRCLLDQVRYTINKDDYKQDCETVEKQFQASIDLITKHQATNPNDARYSEFKNLLIELKERTLNRFKKNDPKFDFSNCMLIADSVHELSGKICVTVITQNDIDSFSKAIAPFKNEQDIGDILILIVAAAITLLAVCAVVGPAVGVALCATTFFVAALDKKRAADPGDTIGDITEATKPLIGKS